MRSRRVGIAAMLVWTLLWLGCVNRERSDVAETREELDRCVAQHGAEHPSCVALRDRLRVEQERYEGAARRAWSCDPAQEECPTPR